MPNRPKPPTPAAVRKYLSEIGKRGGKSRMSEMGPEDRTKMARKGGKVGGPARAKALSAKRRSEISRKAARARWSKPTGKS
jgi:hypothetical protein